LRIGDFHRLKGKIEKAKKIPKISGKSGVLPQPIKDTILTGEKKEETQKVIALFPKKSRPEGDLEGGKGEGAREAGTAVKIASRRRPSAVKGGNTKKNESGSASKLEKKD